MKIRIISWLRRRSRAEAEKGNLFLAELLNWLADRLDR